jgi:hypothetical protein
VTYRPPLTATEVRLFKCTESAVKDKGFLIYQKSVSGVDNQWNKSEYAQVQAWAQIIVQHLSIIVDWFRSLYMKDPADVN